MFVTVLFTITKGNNLKGLSIGELSATKQPLKSILGENKFLLG
jgi:hypothetical protein